MLLFTAQTIDNVPGGFYIDFGQCSDFDPPDYIIYKDDKILKIGQYNKTTGFWKIR